MAVSYIPRRGDIVWTDFDPSAGTEQAFKRPALVLSPDRFNNFAQKLVLVAPITSTIRGHGFEVVLENTKTGGAILCHQIKMIDHTARGVKFIEKAPQPILSDVLEKVRLLVS